jgi:hypothetical protein
LFIMYRLIEMYADSMELMCCVYSLRNSSQQIQAFRRNRAAGKAARRVRSLIYAPVPEKLASPGRIAKF